MSNISNRCAACKYMRRRCPKNCVLAPYFPPDNPRRFSQVHKVFGSSNTAKLLERLPMHLRGEAANCMTIEAYFRVVDPVYGCAGIISQLQQQIIGTQLEIGKVKGEAALHNARQLQQHHVMVHASIPPQGDGGAHHDSAFFFGSSSLQHHPFNFDDQLMPPHHFDEFRF